MLISTPASEHPSSGFPPRNHVGRVLAGRYAILHQIGVGGMARVYRGRHVSLGRPVAVKILREQYAVRASCVGRFLREARATARIHHPNVVEVLDFGQEPDGTVYCVMELLHGEPLSATLTREGSLCWSRTKRVMLQVCDALEAAHAVGVFHRDIKPDNCLRLSPKGATLTTLADPSPDAIKLIDFGIAKLAGEEPALGGRTLAGTVMGTADYMAPEQARGAHTDHRTDVYGAGVLMYELITGQVPFGGSSNVDLLAQHLYVLPKPPSEVAPLARLPSSVDELILRALSKEPDQRFQSIAQMRAAIAAVELPVMAKTTATRELELPRRTPWRKRLGLGFGLAAALVVLGAGVTSAFELDTLARSLVTPVELTRDRDHEGRAPAAPSSEVVEVVEHPKPSTPQPPRIEAPIEVEEPQSVMVRHHAPPPPAAHTSADARPRKRARKSSRRRGRPKN